MESAQYINYTRDCLLKKDHSIQQVDICETYYDGIGEDNMDIRKESLGNASSSYHNDADDVQMEAEITTSFHLLPYRTGRLPITSDTIFSMSAAEIRGERQTWKKECYEDSEFLFSEIFSPEFNPNTIPYEDKIIIEGIDSNVVDSKGLTLNDNWKNILLRNGRIIIHGDVEYLVLKDCVRFHTNAQTELNAMIEGDVAELELIGASPYQ